jgi:hypothetical protein
MKKVLAIACLVAVLVIALAATASAAEKNWRFNIKPDDGNTLNSGGAMTVGVFSTTTTKDPYLPGGEYSPTSDTQDVRNDYGSLADGSKCIVGVFPLDSAGVTDASWIKDVKGPKMPWDDRYADPEYGNNRKIWDLRVAGMPSAVTVTPIRLQFFTISAALLPPKELTHPTLGKLQVKYYLHMLNPRGIPGAPPYCTKWLIPIPTVHSGIAYFTLTLPTLRISTKDGVLAGSGHTRAVELNGARRGPHGPRRIRIQKAQRLGRSKD